MTNSYINKVTTLTYKGLTAKSELISITSRLLRSSIASPCSMLSLSGACHEDVAASTSSRHRQAEVERAQIILNHYQPGLPWSSSSSSPVFGRTLNAGPESLGVVLTDVGMAQGTKEGQALLTDSTTSMHGATYKCFLSVILTCAH